jgi:hypothetical protein
VVSIGQMAELWRNVYEECKGFPSLINDLVSFSLWAAGRAALVVGTARQRGRALTAEGIRETAERTQLLLYAVTASANELERHLERFVLEPNTYPQWAHNNLPLGWGGTLAEGTLAKRLLANAESAIRESRKGKPGWSDLARASSPTLLTVLLPADLVSEYDGLKSQFLMQDFAEFLSAENAGAAPVRRSESPDVAFFRALFAKWKGPDPRPPMPQQ